MTTIGVRAKVRQVNAAALRLAAVVALAGATVALVAPAPNAAAVDPCDAAVCLLTSPGTTLSVSGPSQVNVTGGGITVDSTGPTAANISGSSTVTATGPIGGPAAPAGFVATGTATYSPTPTNFAAQTDPYAGLTTCPAAAECPVNLSSYGGGTATISPGIYSTLNPGGSDVLTLNPGVYIVTSGVHASGSSQIVGSGVTIYLACGAYTAACSGGGEAGASILVDAGASFNVSPPSSGSFAGFTVFSDRNNTSDVNFTGEATGGIIYAASATLIIDAGVSTFTRVVVDSLNVHSGGTLNVNFTPPTPPIPPTPPGPPTPAAAEVVIQPTFTG